MPYYAKAEEKPAICKILETHQPQNDVAYQPGIDAYGRPVVPANLNSASTFKVPEIIKIPITIDLAERLNAVEDGVQLEAPLGMVEIHQDGRVRYNGEDWSQPVATLCGKSHKIEVIEEKELINSSAQEPVSNGHKAEDGIKSSERVIEVEPTVAIPPQDVTIKQLEVDPPIEEEPESDILEGGDYREIYYNE
jgi:hypothetical protein